MPKDALNCVHVLENLFRSYICSSMKWCLHTFFGFWSAHDRSSNVWSQRWLHSTIKMLFTSSKRMVIPGQWYLRTWLQIWKRCWHVQLGWYSDTWSQMIDMTFTKPIRMVFMQRITADQEDFRTIQWSGIRTDYWNAQLDRNVVGNVPHYRNSVSSLLNICQVNYLADDWRGTFAADCGSVENLLADMTTHDCNSVCTDGRSQVGWRFLRWLRVKLLVFVRMLTDDSDSSDPALICGMGWPGRHACRQLKGCQYRVRL